MGGWAFSILSLNARVTLHDLLTVCIFFSNLTFLNNYFRNTIRVPNSVDPEQDTSHFIRPNLGKNCFQRLLADLKSCHEQGKQLNLCARICHLHIEVCEEIQILRMGDRQVLRQPICLLYMISYFCQSLTTVQLKLAVEREYSGPIRQLSLYVQSNSL